MTNNFKKKLFYFQIENGEYLNPLDRENIERLYGLMSYDPDKILENFLNKYMPGFRTSDPLTKISPLLTASNPDALIKMQALAGAKIPCRNGTSNKIRYF